MSPHQILAVAVRLLALWLAISSVGSAISIYHMGDLQFALTFAFLAAIVVVALWIFPQTVARKLLSSQLSQGAAPATPDSWLTMGCALIGLWVISTALPSLVRDLVLLYMARSALTDTTDVYLWLIRDLMEAAIAVWLILGAKGFRKIYWWAQTAGRK